jgi:hypothetical protein
VQIEIGQVGAVLHGVSPNWESWTTISREGIGEAVRDAAQHTKAMHIGEWPCTCEACEKGNDQ